MLKLTRRHRRLQVEVLEDRITPSITFSGFHANYETASDPNASAAGDLTGNGITDVVIGDPVDHVEVWLGDGHGNFTETSSVDVGIDVDLLYLTDLTGNGILDLVGGDSNNHVLFVAMGNGDGTFQNPITWSAPYGCQAMAVGNLTGSGLPDVVVGMVGRVAVYLNDGSGNIFANPTYYNFLPTDSVTSVVIGDFNGDGYGDVAIGDREAASVDVFLNNGNGTLGAMTRYDNPVSNYTDCLAVGDFNNDGYLDIAADYQGSTYIGLMMGNGNGTFQSPVEINTPIQTGTIVGTNLVAADFDQNGDLDLALTGNGNGVILPGNGAGGFGSPISIGGVSYSSGLVAGDFTGDGLLDLSVVGNTSPGFFGDAINTSQHAAAASFNVSAPSIVTAGEPFTLTVTALNDLGDVLPGYTGTIDYSAADQAAGFPASAQFTFEDHGVLNLPVIPKPAGTLTVNLNDSVVTSATGTASLAVIPGPVGGDTSTVSFTSPTDVTGSPDTVTIVVEDSEGNPITGLINGDFSFSLSGASTGTFGNVTETSTPGTYTTTFTGIYSGSASTPTLTINGVPLESQPQITVLPGPVDPNNTTISFASPDDASGLADVVTIEVEDAVGNAVFGLVNNDFSLSTSGGSSSGSFGNVTETSTPGTYTANFVGNIAGGPYTLTLLIDNLEIVSQPQVTVIPGPADPNNSTFSLASPTDESGTPDQATITLVDAAGNAITGLHADAFNFDLTQGTSSGTFVDLTDTSIPGTYTANFIGGIAGTASTATLAINNVQLNAQPMVTVTPGAVDQNNTTYSIADSIDASGVLDPLTIFVEDAAGNAISGLAGNAFSLSLLVGGTSTGSFGSVTETLIPGKYTAPFRGIIAGSTSVIDLVVNQIAIDNEPTVQVIPGPVNGGTTTVAFASSTDASGSLDPATIVVEDAAGNPISGLASNNFNPSLSGGTSTGAFGNVSPTSTPGTYTVPFTGIDAGTPDSLQLSIEGTPISSEPTVQVIPGPVSAVHTTATFASQLDVSGTPDIATILVEDAAGNAISGLTNDDFSLSIGGGTSTGLFGTVSPTSTPGTYTVPFTGYNVGTVSELNFSVTGVPIQSEPSIQVTDGFLGGAINLNSSSDASGTADSATIVVEDAAGNPITGLNSNAFSFSLSGGSSTGSFGNVTETSTPGTYTTNFTGIIAGSASTITVAIDSFAIPSQPEITVTPGAVDAGQTAARFANSTVASGSTDAVTIDARDAAGNLIPGLAGNLFDLSLTGGASQGEFGAVTPASPGVYTSILTGTIAGTPSSLNLVIDGATILASPRVQVIPGPVNPGATTATFASQFDASGTPDIATILVEDVDGNAIDGLINGDFSLSLIGGTSTGSFGNVSPTSTPGTYTVPFMGYTAGSPGELIFTVTGVPIQSEPSLQVTFGAVSGNTSAISLNRTSDVSGTPDTATIVVEDAAGNAITGLPSDAFSFGVAGGSSTGSFGSVTETASPGTYTTNFTGIIAGSTSTIALAIDGAALSTQPPITVTPGAVDAGQTTSSFALPTVTAGSTDSLTIDARDAAGNLVPNLAPNLFDLALSGGVSQGTFGTVAEESPGVYTSIFTGITAGTPSSLTLTINDVPIDASPSVQVVPGPVNAANSSITLASPTDHSGTPDTATIVLQDAYGNLIEGLQSNAFNFSISGGTSTGSFGLVNPTSTPGTYTADFTGAIAGTPTTITLNVSGIALLTQPRVTVTCGTPAAALSTVSLTSSNMVAGSTDTLEMDVKDAAGNPVTNLTSGDIDFSFAGGNSNGDLDGITQSSTPGTYAAVLTGWKAGTSSSLVVTIDNVQINQVPKIQVNVGALSGITSSVSFASPTDVSGTTDLAAIVVEDVAGNPITGLPSTAFVLSFAGGTSTGALGKVVASSTPGTYTASFTGILAGTTKTLAVKVDGTALVSHPTLQVIPGAPSAAKTTVTVAAASNISGQSDLVTMIVKDASGNFVTGLTNDNFSFAFAGGASTANMGMVSATSKPGVYTVPLIGYKSGTASALAVKINNTLMTEKPKVTVKPGAVSAANSSVSFAASTLAMGTTDLLTITVADAVNNPITGLTRAAIVLSLSGSKSAGKFGVVLTATATPGKYTIAFTPTAAGTASTLSAKINGVALSAQPAVLVIPAVSATKSTVSFATSTVLPGQTDTVTIVLNDATGAPESGLPSSDFLLSLSGGTSKGTFGTVTETSTPGTYTVVFTATTKGTANTLTIKAAGVILSAKPKVTVT